MRISDWSSDVCSSDLFGKSDPNVRKATAIINGEIITGTDVDQRLALIINANGGKVEEQEKERLRLQVLRNLIDETIQIQEAKANDIVVDRAEIDQSYARVAQNFGQNPQQFENYRSEEHTYVLQKLMRISYNVF